MNVGRLILLPVALLVAPAFASVDFDPCKKEEKKFESTAKAIDARLDATQAKYAKWGEDPSTVPEDILGHYRLAVRAFALQTWQETPSGQELSKLWKEKDPNVDISSEFMTKIYPKEITDETEVRLARALFAQDYKETIKPELDKQVKTVRDDMATKKKELDEACSSDEFSKIVRSTLGNLVKIVNGNFDAAKNEKGELASLVRATSGISITDILKNGSLAGGSGSEVNKLRRTWSDALDKAGIGKNHVIREGLAKIDVTRLKLPDEAKITVDKKSIENTTRNLSLGMVKDGKVRFPKLP